MDRWLYASRTVHGVPADLERALQANLDELLAAGPQDGAADAINKRHSDGSITASLTSRIAGQQVMKQVRLRVGVAYRRMACLHIPLRWTADPVPRAFPSFEGYIELEPLSALSGRLTLVGRYQPPLGPVGAVVDALGLRGVATNTATALIERVAAGVEQRLLDNGRVAGPTDDVPSREGRAGLLRVRDVMTPNPVVLEPDMPLRTAANLLLHFGISGAPIVSVDGELLGVLSEADLLEKEATEAPGARDPAARRRRSALTTGQACTRPARTTHPDVPLHDAARAMLEHKVSRLIAVAGTKLVGIITRHDILNALTRSDAELQRLVTAALQAEGHTTVEVTVDWGVAAIRGEVPTRSATYDLVRAITDIDGIVGSDTEELSWHYDDVAVSMPLS